MMTDDCVLVFAGHWVSLRGGLVRRAVAGIGCSPGCTSSWMMAMEGAESDEVRRGMDACVHSGTLSHSRSAPSPDLEIDLWACASEVEWRQRWACICTGRESGGRVDGRGERRRTQVQSDGWVTGGNQVRGDGQVRGDDQVTSAFQIRAHG